MFRGFFFKCSIVICYNINKLYLLTYVLTYFLLTYLFTILIYLLS